ncbi:MAG: hypothetical protein IJU16_05390 [Clostridia bacterium]|nr:hypothetical protein [Clostridia bacterium]
MRLRFENIEKITNNDDVIRELLARGYAIVADEDNAIPPVDVEPQVEKTPAPIVTDTSDKSEDLKNGLGHYLTRPMGLKELKKTLDELGIYYRPNDKRDVLERKLSEYHKALRKEKDDE